MKVLLLHQHFKTPHGGGAIRSYYLAKALIDTGVEVVVVTGHDESYKKEIIEGIEVRFLKVPYDNSYGFWRRGFSFLRFYWKAVEEAKDLQDADLCYAISVPLTVGLAARKIKKRYHIPFLFEVGDLWPDAPVQLGFVKNQILSRFLYNMERKNYQSASVVVALSPAIKSAIEKKMPGKRVELLPNMADTDFFKKASKNSALVKKFDVEGKFVVSYIGAIGVANGLSYLVDCANVTRKSGLAIQFILCGKGAMKKELLAKIEQLELQNITVLDFATRDHVKEIMDISDAAFICYKPVLILETGSPNKFFDALAAGKLSIINFGGWIKEEIETNKCGIYVDPYQPADFVKKIKPFLSDRMLLDNYQFHSRSLAEKKYSRRELSKKFSNLISEFN